MSNKLRIQGVENPDSAADLSVCEVRPTCSTMRLVFSTEKPRKKLAILPSGADVAAVEVAVCEFEREITAPAEALSLLGGDPK